MRVYTRDTRKTCPCCGSEGDVEFIEIPYSTRQYTDTDGEEVTEYIDTSRDYSCRNCGCEFTLTQRGG